MADTTRTLQQEPSIRLFRNDFLEALTHVHPIVPLLFWSPVVGWLLWRSVFVHELPAAGLLGVALAGCQSDDVSSPAMSATCVAQPSAGAAPLVVRGPVRA